MIKFKKQTRKMLFWFISIKIVCCTLGKYNCILLDKILFKYTEMVSFYSFLFKFQNRYRLKQQFSKVWILDTRPAASASPKNLNMQILRPDLSIWNSGRLWGWGRVGEGVAVCIFTSSPCKILLLINIWIRICTVGNTFLFPTL